MISSSEPGRLPSGGPSPAATSGVPLLADPPADTAEPLAVVGGSLTWARTRVLSKLDGLGDADLRTAPGPLAWSPLGLVRHLTWVERRWIRWGYLGEATTPHPPDGDEWCVGGLTTAGILADYRAEAEHSDRCARVAGFTTPSRPGGRFAPGDTAPTLGRILVHLHQEYARHLGQLDVARELLDGSTGE